MFRSGLRPLVTLVLGATILAFAGAPTAGALTPDAHAASFVGVYSTHAKLDDQTKYARSTITVNADGTVLDNKDMKFATWSNSGTTITINYADSQLTEVLTAQQTKTGLGSKKKLGTFTVSDGTNVATGTWWAVRAA